MGITGFRALLEKHAPGAIRIIDAKTVPCTNPLVGVTRQDMIMHNFKNVTFCVEVAMFMHQFRYHSTHEEDESFLQSFLTQYDELRCGGVNRVCYVFDGSEAVHDKAAELQKRAVQRTQQQQRVDTQMAEVTHQKDAMDGSALKRVKAYRSDLERKRTHGEAFDAHDLDAAKEAVAKAEAEHKQMMETHATPAAQFAFLEQCNEKAAQLQRYYYTVQSHHYQRLREIFRAHRVPYFEAVGEGEFGAAWLATKGGYGNVVVSNDWDTVISGAACVLRNMSSAKKPMEIIAYDDVCRRLDLSPEQLTDVAILGGCDFCTTLPRVGIHTGYKMIRRYGSIEAYLASADGIKFAQDEKLMARFSFATARKRLRVTDDTNVQVHISINK